MECLSATLSLFVETLAHAMRSPLSVISNEASAFGSADPMSASLVVSKCKQISVFLEDLSDMFREKLKQPNVYSVINSLLPGFLIRDWHDATNGSESAIVRKGRLPQLQDKKSDSLFLFFRGVLHDKELIACFAADCLVRDLDGDIEIESKKGEVSLTVKWPS